MKATVKFLETVGTVFLHMHGYDAYGRKIKDHPIHKQPKKVKNGNPPWRLND